MLKCDICGKEDFMLHKCTYCGGRFCNNHRLPEKHDCIKIPKAKGGWFALPSNWDRSGISGREHHLGEKNRKVLDEKFEKVRQYDEKRREKRQVRKIHPRIHRVNRRKLKILGKILLIVLLLCIGSVAAWKSGVFSEEINQKFEVAVEYLSSRTNTMMNMSITEILNAITTYLRGVRNSTQEGIERIRQPKNVYGNYSFGLVKSSDGVMVDSYGRYLVLIDNRNTKDLTYNQLLKFLKEDDTDEYLYQKNIIRIIQPYSGTAESNVDLTLWRGIVNGTEDMMVPRICADFAQRLHNTAEMLGIRCGYVSINLGSTGHALVVFNTTDRGLIYIDCTGVIGGYGPSNCDKIIDNLQVGKDYIPRSLFPESGWESTWGNIGEVTSICITWDGDWN